MPVYFTPATGVIEKECIEISVLSYNNSMFETSQRLLSEVQLSSNDSRVKFSLNKTSIYFIDDDGKLQNLFSALCLKYVYLELQWIYSYCLKFNVMQTQWLLSKTPPICSMKNQLQQL